MKKETRSELHVHDMHDFLDGYSTPRELFEQARKVGLKALAITPHANQFANPYMQKLSDEFSEIKLIHGTEFYECLDMNIKDKSSKYFHLIALAKNENGRKLINKLLTEASEDGMYFKPRISLDRFPKNCEDLVVTSACLASKLNREKDYQKCIEYIEEYKSYFKHFYLEIQPSRQLDQVEYNKKIKSLARDTKTKVTVACDVHYATKEDASAHGMLVNISKSKIDTDEIYDGCYIMTCDEIHEYLDDSLGRDFVSWCMYNSNEIADLIEDVKIPFQEPKLPHFPLPSGFDSEDEYLKHLCEKGLEMRGIDKNDKRYIDRIKTELDVIIPMGFSGYFLIVSDLLKWCKANGVLVGAGRGSAGGSLVCYLLDIVTVDPIYYNLHFERFLNKERIELPDIDSDLFGKERAIMYLQKKFGKNSVCQVANFSTITPKVSIRDVAKQLRERGLEDVSKKDTESISNLFVSDDFDECMSINQSSLEEYVEKYPLLFGFAKKLSGRVRGRSIHAGAVCCSQTELHDYMPVTVESDGARVIHCDKRIVEQIGLVKIDALSLGTLGVIKTTLDLLGKDVDYIDTTNLEFLKDKKTYELLSSGDSEYVFQLSSHEMQNLLQKVKPTNIDEISDVLALYRPDSMPYIPEYIRVKDGGKSEYIHGDMEKILSKTKSVLIYQETLMEVVRVFGGRTLGGADKFRKGIGKKDKDLVKRESETLRKEILDNGYSEDVADSISSEMETKGGYLFNRSHSVQYAINSYITAFLKANHKTHFYCSNLIHAKDKNDYSKVGKLILSCKKDGIEILPPNINKSEKTFTVKDGKIYYGIGSIKGVGEDVVGRIIENRPYKSVSDAIERCGLNKRQVTALIYSGAFGSNKELILKKYFEYCYDGKDKEFSPVKSTPSIAKLKSEWGIVGSDKEDRLRQYNEVKRELFVKQQREKKLKHYKEMNDKYMIPVSRMEFESLSTYLTVNPFEKTIGIIKPFQEFTHGSDGVIAGTIMSIQNKKDRSGRKYCYLDTLTLYGIVEVVVFASTYANIQSHIKVGNEVVMKLKVQDTSICSDIKYYSDWLKEKKIK